MPLGAPPSELPHFSQLSVLRASPVYTNSLYLCEVENIEFYLLLALTLLKINPFLGFNFCPDFKIFFAINNIIWRKTFDFICANNPQVKFLRYVSDKCYIFVYFFKAFLTEIDIEKETLMLPNKNQY